MIECFSCGVSNEEARLHDAIHKTGVVKICSNCSEKFSLPIIEKKQVDWKKVDESGTVRQRLAGLAKTNVSETRFAKKPEDVNLRDIVEENLKNKAVKLKEEYSDLIYNFHWVIMRKRRALGMSRARFASLIEESEEVTRALEAGNLPVDYKELVLKVERVLATSLRKVEKVVEVNEVQEAEDGIEDIEIEKGDSFFKKFWKNVKESFAVKDDDFVEGVDDILESAVVEEVDAEVKVDGASVEVEPAALEVPEVKKPRVIDYRERLAIRARERAEEMRRIRAEKDALRSRERTLSASVATNEVVSDSAAIARANAEIARKSAVEAEAKQKMIDELLKRATDGDNQTIAQSNNQIAEKEFNDVIEEVRESSEEEGIREEVEMPTLQPRLYVEEYEEPMVLEENEYEREEPEYESPRSYEEEMAKLQPKVEPEVSEKQEELNLGDKEELSPEDVHRIAWGGR